MREFRFISIIILYDLVRKNLSHENFIKILNLKD